MELNMTPDADTCPSVGPTYLNSPPTHHVPLVGEQQRPRLSSRKSTVVIMTRGSMNASHPLNYVRTNTCIFPSLALSHVCYLKVLDDNYMLLKKKTLV